MPDRGRSRSVLHLALGGTIACVKTRAGLVPRLGAADLLSSVRPPPRVVVQGLDVGRMTTLLPRDWVALARRIARAYASHDGFVVTLGTDTLAYVAAALTVMLENLGKPIVLTGAMRPMGDAQSDGRRNLTDALRVAAADGVAGVLVVFHGRILDGGRASKVRCDGDDAFESIGAPLLGRVRGAGIEWQGKPRPPQPRAVLALRDALDPNVATCKLTPEVGAAWVRGFERCHGVVVEGYGDGNVPTELVPALARLAKRRLVVLASQCTYGAVAHRYEGGRALIRAGALSAGDATKEMAHVRLMWALGLGLDRRAAKRWFRSSRSIRRPKRAPRDPSFGVPSPGR